MIKNEEEAYPLPAASASPAVLKAAFQLTLPGCEVPGVLHAVQPKPDAVVPSEMHRGIEREVPAAAVEGRHVEGPRRVLLVDVYAVVPFVDTEDASPQVQREVFSLPARLGVPEPAELLAPQRVESARGRPSAPAPLEVGAQVVAQRELLRGPQPPAPAQLRSQDELAECQFRLQLDQGLVLRLPFVEAVGGVGGADYAESLPAERDSAVLLPGFVEPARLQGELASVFRHPDQAGQAA